jgi:hypothetical protein
MFADNEVEADWHGELRLATCDLTALMQAPRRRSARSSTRLIEQMDV